MKGFLRQIGPRYGISFALVIVVALIVVIGNLLPHASKDPFIRAGVDGSPQYTATGPPDDGGSGLQSPEPPITSPGEAPPQVVATSFAEAWLHHTGVTASAWHRAIAKYSTKALSVQLADTDPASVPADHIAGVLTLTHVSAAYVEVSIPTDSGTLVLALQADRGQWLVSSVDWDRP